jgi:hypothetical protein
MQPEWIKKMSKRDKARQQFVRAHRKRQQIKNSYRQSVYEQMDLFRDAEEGIIGAKQRSY